MNDPSTFPVTLNDIEIGARLAQALLHHLGRPGARPITYPALLELARFLDPKDAAMDRAEPLGIEAKLRFVADFCAAHGHPNLASLAVHPVSLLPGAACAGMTADGCEAERRAAAAHDWAGAPAQLAAFARARSARVPPRLKPRKERPAEVSWYAYFSAHREACKGVSSADKKEVINLLMAGLDPATALRRFLAAKAAWEAAQEVA